MNPICLRRWGGYIVPPLSRICVYPCKSFHNNSFPKRMGKLTPPQGGGGGAQYVGYRIYSNRQMGLNIIDHSNNPEQNWLDIVSIIVVGKELLGQLAEEVHFFHFLDVKIIGLNFIALHFIAVQEQKKLTDFKRGEKFSCSQMLVFRATHICEYIQYSSDYMNPYWLLVLWWADFVNEEQTIQEFRRYNWVARFDQIFNRIC